MRLSHLALNIGLIFGAALLSLLVAFLAAGGVERAAINDITSRFALEGIEGVTVTTSGLEVTLSGEVESEAARFRAISVAGQVVDNTRVVDHIEITPSEIIMPPDFSVEILRNDAGIQLIGLIPASADRDALAAKVADIAEGAEVVDLLQTADYPTPENWDSALKFAMDALARLPRSKISAAPGRVSVTAIAASAGEKRSLEAALSRLVPGGLDLSLNVTAPRPVITPFTLRFLIDADGARFDACTAHSEEGRARILAAARGAGMPGEAHCPVALGAPTREWHTAVVAAIGAIGELGAGSVTFSDADITLVAAEGTEPALFDRVIGELEAALPEVFSLHAVLPRKAESDGSGDNLQGAPEFVATLSPEGQVQLRGRLRDDMEREVAESFARARFGIDAVYMATRLDADLPQGWLVRVLAALESLSYLSNGAVVVQPDVVDIQGNTGNQDANAEIARIMGEKLGEAQDFRVSVTYQEALDPVASLPSPQECVERLNLILQEQKITFAPGSADIVASARDTIDKIAEAMKECEDVAMEIGGFTDSQGREEMNKALSQARAQAVLNALLARRVLTSNLVAHGYGEENPIADNDTEEGREANRRIEFRLLLPAQGAEATGDAAPEDGAEGAEGQAHAGQTHAPDATGDGTPEEDTPANAVGAQIAPARPTTGDTAGESN